MIRSFAILFASTLLALCNGSTLHAQNEPKIDFGLALPMPQAPAPEPVKRDVGPPPSKEIIATNLTKLASDDYPTRLAGKSELLKFGIDHPDTILNALADPYFAASDIDLRTQLRMLIWNTIRFDLNDRPIGFVGIQMSDSSIFEAQGKVRRTVQVLQVIEDTAAAKFGLRFGDHIVEVNKMTFDNGGRPSEKFQQYIQQLTVGDPVKLKINRAGKDLEIDIDLGERPLNLAGTANPEIMRLTARFDQYIEDESRKRGLLKEEPLQNNGAAPSPADDPFLPEE